jgi:hypothetical protein
MLRQKSVNNGSMKQFEIELIEKVKDMEREKSLDYISRMDKTNLKIITTLIKLNERAENTIFEKESI